jgi:hypothetical protein
MSVPVTIACRPKPKEINCRIVNEQPEADNLTTAVPGEGSLAGSPRRSIAPQASRKNFFHREFFGFPEPPPAPGSPPPSRSTEPEKTCGHPIFQHRESPAIRADAPLSQRQSAPARQDSVTQSPIGNHLQSVHSRQPLRRSDPRPSDRPAQIPL